MAIDPEKFRAPFIPLEEIHKKADSFRNRYWSQDSLPVDIAGIVEFDLRLEIRPIKNLRSELDTDALLLGDLKSLVVDYDDYMKENMQNRLRFSLAHEVGHLVLHSDLFQDLAHENVEDWIEFISKIPDDQYGFVEYHAYEFAGRLLVPVEELNKSLEESLLLARKSNIDLSNFDSDMLQVYLSNRICKRYGVSDQVIQRRLTKEKLWPPKEFEER